jgi:RNA polymerase sigma factor (sigma-70 family)
MEQPTREATLDARILKHIRHTAKRLARQGRMPGMDADDIAQDLFLDLWRRRAAFDPSRASFVTFADRVIAHRVASLLCSTARLRAERQHLSLDEGDDGAERPVLADSLPDPQAVSEADQALALDVRRFLEGLPPALRRCCDLLLTPNLRAASAEAGLHRSTIYENARRLRRLAERAGLRDYVAAPRHFADRTGRWPA